MTPVEWPAERVNLATFRLVPAAVWRLAPPNPDPEPAKRAPTF